MDRLADSGSSLRDAGDRAPHERELVCRRKLEALATHERVT